jgi:transcriptional regulator with XRE-family HTH domain
MLKLADRLRGLRGTESQTAFAARFGLKQAIYSHYETGRKKPSLEVLVDMAITLGATTDYLLGLSDEPPNRPAATPREIITGDNSPVAIGSNITQTVNASRKRKSKR